MEEKQGGGGGGGGGLFAGVKSWVGKLAGPSCCTEKDLEALVGLGEKVEDAKRAAREKEEVQREALLEGRRRKEETAGKDLARSGSRSVLFHPSHAHVVDLLGLGRYVAFTQLRERWTVVGT